MRKGIIIIKNAIKFLQAYIKEMINLGGENLPKTISSTLGVKLAKIYKSREISTIEDGLKQCYNVLRGKSRIIKVSDKKYEISIKYRRKFCPIGGNYNPNIAEIVQKSICIPYTTGFLNELEPKFKFSADLHECILSSNKSYCRYTLYLEEKIK